jgi:hypothetical protein
MAARQAGCAARVLYSKRLIHILQNAPTEICCTGTLLSGSVGGFARLFQNWILYSEALRKSSVACAS